jgi:hypothetical protein
MKHSSVTATIIVAAIISILFSATTDTTKSSTIALNTNWKLTITGQVDTPLNLTIADLLAMPQTTLFAQIYCVGPPGFFVEEGNWTGVKLNFLLQKAGINSTATKIAFYATDGFTTDLTPSFAMDDSIIVAYEKNNLPLDETLRLVVPGRWGYKWIYHLSRIEAVDYNFLGKYESQGYSDTALTTNTGGVGDVGDQLPNPTGLNRNSPSPTTRPTPSSTSNINSPSPSASHSTTPNTESGTGFKVEEAIYLIAALIIVIAALTLFYYQQKRRKKY